MIHKNIRTIEGNRPVLISGPHTAPILKMNNTVKPKEIKIDEIIENICKKEGFWGMYIDPRERVDNWRAGARLEYKRVAKNIIENNNIALFFDIHGARASSPFSVDYDFVFMGAHPHDGIIEEALIRNVKKNLPDSIISTGFFRRRNGPGSRTVTYYIRRNLAIPGMQIEINKKIRKNNEQLDKLIKSLVEAIEEYENTFIRV